MVVRKGVPEAVKPKLKADTDAFHGGQDWVGRESITQWNESSKPLKHVN